MVAITIASTSSPNCDIRLSDDGKPNPAELARIRHSIAGLPAVEVLTAEDPPRRLALLPHATLVGWLSGKEILVIENGILTAFDVGSGARRTSPIKVPGQSFVFLR